RPKKTGGDRVRFSKITACPNLRNQTSTNSESSCLGSARSFGDAYSSEAIQPSPIYTSFYKSPLAGPTTIFIASLFMANNTASLTSAGSLFVMTLGGSNFPTSACASKKSSSTKPLNCSRTISAHPRTARVGFGTRQKMWLDCDDRSGYADPHREVESVVTERAKRHWLQVFERARADPHKRP